MRPKRIVVIGGGINGLVSAFYLRRAGHDVTVIERQPEIGGAGRNGQVHIGGRTYTFALGATLLGQMQRFVAEDLGLFERLKMGPSPHPSLYAFPGERPFYFLSDPGRLDADMKSRGWDARGLEDYERDGAKVVAFVQEGFRQGRQPTYGEAEAVLGRDLTETWIRGSARGCLDRYLHDERLKVIMGKDVIESGPVPFSAPGTAFALSLLDAGGIFGGKWGYVWGGMGNLLRTIADICREAGIRIIVGAQVLEVEPSKHRVSYLLSGACRNRHADHVVFATDPVTAAELLDHRPLRDLTGGLELDGSSGKLIMLFREPLKWRDDTGEHGFDSCLKFFFQQATIDQLDLGSRAVREGADFIPGYCEVYCEGAGLRMLGLDRGYESAMVFFKHLGTSKSGDELSDVRRRVEDEILGRTLNGREALIHSRLLSPADMSRLFHFPKGNIDHVMITTDQTFDKRAYGYPSPRRAYQLWDIENVSYCGAGAYPCGSVAGTAGYMCATELLRTGF
jgi:phytoene dehydrogenase-like protein